MSTIKFPFTYHCPKCKAKLKVKSEEMVGKRVPCPQCKARIEILTPDEDGHVAYDIGEVQVQKEKTEQQVEDEMVAYEEKKLLEAKARTKARIRWTLGLCFYLGLLGATGYGYWYFILRGYGKRAAEKKEDDGSAFGKIFDTN